MSYALVSIRKHTTSASNFTVGLDVLSSFNLIVFRKINFNKTLTSRCEDLNKTYGTVPEISTEQYKFENCKKNQRQEATGKINTTFVASNNFREHFGNNFKSPLGRVFHF